MKKTFKGTVEIVEHQTVSIDTLLELLDSEASVSIADIMHKDMKNLSMDVADSSSDQNLWSSKKVSGGIDGVMHYFFNGPLAEHELVYVHADNINTANETAETLQGIYDAESAAAEEMVEAVFKEEKEEVDSGMDSQASKAEMAKQFWNENSGAVVNARKANTNKKDDVKMTKTMKMPKLKSTVAVEETVEAAPTETPKQAPKQAPKQKTGKSKMPGLKQGVVKEEAPAPKGNKNEKRKQPNWYTNPDYYPVLNRFNEIIDNMRYGRMVDSVLGIEELVIVQTEDIKRYATRNNAKDYLFIIQIKTSGVVFDFPIKRSDAYSNADLYSESISFSRESGKLRPVFTFTHPNSIQVMAQCTCGHNFKANTSFLYCPKCKTNHGAAEVSFSHPSIELTEGHKFARTTPTNVHIHPDTLALVMAIAQLKNGGDMNGIYK